MKKKATYEEACACNGSFFRTETLREVLQQNQETRKAHFAKRDAALADIGWTFEEILAESRRRMLEHIEVLKIAEKMKEQPE